MPIDFTIKVLRRLRATRIEGTNELRPDVGDRAPRRRMGRRDVRRGGMDLVADLKTADEAR